MTENLVFMQVEDNMVSFERNDGSTIIYPQELVPEHFKEGDIIISIVHSEEHIEFIEINVAEMKARHARITARAARIRCRAKRSTDGTSSKSKIGTAILSSDSIIPIEN